MRCSDSRPMNRKRSSAIGMLARAEEPDACGLVNASEPLALLRRIAQEHLPLVLTDDRDFDAVSALVNAGQIEAAMQVVMPLGSGPQPGVVVRRITPQGWTALDAPMSEPWRAL